MNKKPFSGFGAIKTSNRSDSLRLEEVVDLMKFEPDQWHVLRILPIQPLQVKQAWLEIYAGGKDKKVVKVPRYVTDFDPDNPDTPIKGVKCPYRALVNQDDYQHSPVKINDFWLFNVIDREKQEDGPPRRAAEPTAAEKKSGFKDKSSKSYTPVRVARLTSTIIGKIKELSEDNLVKLKSGTKVFDCTDPRYGFDIKIKYRPKAKGADCYSVQGLPRSRLTEEENGGYLVWNLTSKLLDDTGRLTYEQALEDVARMTVRGHENKDDEESSVKRRSLLDDEDDEDEVPRRKKSSAVKKRALDDDEDEPPRRKKVQKSLDEDDEDEPPRRKKVQKSLDEDEEDEVPPRRAKTPKKSVGTVKKAAKKPSIPWDEDGE